MKPKYRLDYATRTIYEYSEDHNAYLFYGHFHNVTKFELNRIKSLSDD